MKAGLIFMDIGCGGGFFSLPAARLVGSKGRVYGIDPDREAIARIKEKAEREGLENIDLTVGKAEETILCEACADIIFFGIVLHDFNNPAKVLMNAKKMLKYSGLLINLDWKKEPMNIGPPIQIRFSEERAVKFISDAGFTVEAAKDSGPYHYIIIAKL